MNVSQIIWERLKQETEVVFYLPGGGSGPLVDALGASGLRAVCCLHEQGCGYAAVGYAQYHGFGVALVTSGPGVTNILTPVLAAWVDSIALLVISGQVMRKWLALDDMRSRGTQEGPTIEMVRPIVKIAHQPSVSAGILEVLDGMIEIAKEGRPGPVWLDIPQDIQAADV